MKLHVKIQLLTFSSEVLNFIFLALGLSVFLCGLWILFDIRNLLTARPSDELRTVGAGLMIIGGVVGVVSVVGFVSAVKENKILLLTYQGFLIILVFSQLFITLLLLLNKGEIEKKVDNTLDHLIVHYRGDTESQDTLVDNIQHYEKCCGFMGPSDWLKNLYLQNLTDVLPCSCFNFSRNSTRWCYKQPDNMYTEFLNQGCTKKVSNWLQENINTITGMVIGLMFIQMVLFVLMVSLYYAIKSKAALKMNPPTDTDHTPLDLSPEDDLINGEQNYSYIDPDDGYTDPAHPAQR
ncbi:CD82 antigen [Labrus mixtus]|uniref:CD82 antigen n=1 Tax=Labrus mixtus TaxID=508554 RepID=UPI0029BFB1BD|nr:CD82 antigen [Labrus mixtus]